MMRETTVGRHRRAKSTTRYPRSISYAALVAVMIAMPQIIGWH